MHNTLAVDFTTDAAKFSWGRAAEILDLRNGFQHEEWVHQCRECLGEELGMTPEQVHLMLSARQFGTRCLVYPLSLRTGPGSCGLWHAPGSHDIVVRGWRIAARLAAK